MSWTFVFTLAPVNPFFKPTAEALQKVYDQLSTGEFIQTSKPASLLDIEPVIELFPLNFQFPEPDDWTEETIELYSRLFEPDYDIYYDDDHPELKGGRTYYLDEDHLRHQKEMPIYTSNLKDTQISSLKPYIEERGLIHANLPMSDKFEKEILHKGRFSSFGSFQLICGFHYRKNALKESLLLEEEDYLDLFPYAPKARNDDGNILLSYAGSFSISVYSYTPLFGNSSRFEPEHFKLRDAVESFKRTMPFYLELKPLLEQCLKQKFEFFFFISY